MRILRSVGSDLGASRLERWQQDRIVKNYVLDFPEFREISLFDPDGQLVVTSRTGKATVAVPKQVGSPDGVDIAAFKVDDDLLPTTTISIRLGRSGEEMGWIVGELSLEELWRMVDHVRVGTQGYALIVGDDGRLIAHGNPEEKRHIATNESNAASEELKFAARIRQDANAEPSAEYHNDNGEEMLGVAARMTDPNWTVVVEQPTAEAFAVTRRLERQLIDRHRARPARHGRARLAVGPLVHPAHLRADARHALDCGGQAGRRASRSRDTTRSASSATPSTRWPIGSSSCRRTSGSRNGR